MLNHAEKSPWWTDVLKSAGRAPHRHVKGTVQNNEVYARALARAHIADLRMRKNEHLFKNCGK